MEDKELAELKDIILKWLIEYGSGDLETINNQLGKPMVDESHLRELIEDMRIDGGKYFDYLEDNPFYVVSKNDLTKIFLDKGGFVNQYESDLEADIEAEKLNKRDERLKSLQEQNLDLANQLSILKLKTHMLPIIISFLSLAFAAFALFKPSDTISKQDFRDFQDNVEKLKIDFKKENDNLKVRLKNAEMLIAIYESDSLN